MLQRFYYENAIRAHYTSARAGKAFAFNLSAKLFRDHHYSTSQQCEHHFGNANVLILQRTPLISNVSNPAGDELSPLLHPLPLLNSDTDMPYKIQRTPTSDGQPKAAASSWRCSLSSSILALLATAVWPSEETATVGEPARYISGGTSLLIYSLSLCRSPCSNYAFTGG
ncbi:hypothetical protein GUJ93_ZPchr0013g34169 [Zizania palustris]|uniref:Uncharacterized protein n=1 Tax=Zizania palustris TaxID=103762 RepID=A0A8J5X116_ZIZPA|nr:hypothetical protein GUJ93_ZPchr0013g34169 [Zizania palustris]